MWERKWKKFDGVATRVVKDAIRASVNPVGEITFDIETYKRMGEPQALVLMYEEETRTIGLEPSHADEPEAVLVRPRHKASNRCVRAMAFLKQNDIDVPTTLRFPYPHFEGDVLILDLRTTVKMGKGWREIERRQAAKVANIERRSAQERDREQRRRENEALKAERKRLSDERARVRREERELIRLRREWERNQARKERELIAAGVLPTKGLG